MFCHSKSVVDVSPLIILQRQVYALLAVLDYASPIFANEFHFHWFIRHASLEL